MHSMTHWAAVSKKVRNRVSDNFIRKVETE